MKFFDLVQMQILWRYTSEKRWSKKIANSISYLYSEKAKNKGHLLIVDLPLFHLFLYTLDYTEAVLICTRAPKKKWFV